MTPIYIFDIDGTLADCTHRLHFLKNEDDPERWRKFYDACVHDAPIRSTLGVHDALGQSADIIYITGRTERVRQATEDWLLLHSFVGQLGYRKNLIMRPDDDHSPDHEFKRRAFLALPNSVISSVVAVFEDRARVVQMWRGLGLTCYQVADGQY